MNKKKLLMWSDFFGPSIGTGFGTVSRHMVKILKNTFDIDQLAINYRGEFFDSKEWPVQVSPAKLKDPKDPHGCVTFLETVHSGNYDYVWIMNDTFVVHQIGNQLKEVLQNLEDTGRKVPIVIYYFPIDCTLAPGAFSMLEAAHHLVAYTEFGKQEVLKKLPHLANKMSVIPHGSNQADFRKLPTTEKSLLRKQIFGVEDDSTFIWMTCNRNSQRKDIARTLLAFSEFRKTIPNSKLYLHTAIKDTNVDLSVPMFELGLRMKEDVIFPKDYKSSSPLSVEILNAFYNTGDAFISTALGGGFELTSIEAACVGLPLVLPNYTCFPEQFGNGRGYLYDCKEKIYIDNQGFRSLGRLEDILQTMNTCYREVCSGESVSKTNKASEYVESISWSRVGAMWLELFNKVKLPPKKIEGFSL